MIIQCSFPLKLQNAGDDKKIEKYQNINPDDANKPRQCHTATDPKTMFENMKLATIFSSNGCVQGVAKTGETAHLAFSTLDECHK